MSEENIEQDNKPKIDPIEAMKSWIDGMVMCNVRGIISSMPNMPPSVVLIHVSRSMGKWIGSLFVGRTQVDSFKYRKECKNAFIEGMESAEMISADDKPMVKPKDATCQ